MVKYFGNETSHSIGTNYFAQISTKVGTHTIDWLQVSSMEFSQPIKKDVENSVKIVLKNTMNGDDKSTIYYYKIALIYKDADGNEIDTQYLLWGSNKTITNSTMLDTDTFRKETIENGKSITKTVSFVPRWTSGIPKSIDICIGFKHTAKVTNQGYNAVAIFPLVENMSPKLINYSLISERQVNLIDFNITTKSQTPTDNPTLFDMNIDVLAQYQLNIDDEKTYVDKFILGYSIDGEPKISIEYNVTDLTNPMFTFNQNFTIEDVGENVTFTAQYAYTADGVTVYTPEVSLSVEIMNTVHLHLSGALDSANRPIGGVAVGGYSTVTEETGAMFECFYPAVFHNTVTFNDGGIKMDGGRVELAAGSGTKSKDITFNKTFAQQPAVVITFEYSGTTIDYGYFTFITNVTKDGFTANISSSHSSTYNGYINWIAIGM